MPTIFHASDLHFGHPAVPEQYEAIEALIADRRFDVVAISGDVSQRARAGEFQRARAVPPPGAGGEQHDRRPRQPRCEVVARATRPG